MKKIFVIFAAAMTFMLSYSLSSFSSPRNVLVEYATGTWCGWCPCGHQALETIVSTFPNTLAIAYHGASSDPWQNFEGYAVRGLLGFNAYPTAIIDRTNTPSNPYVTYDQWFGKVSDRYSTSPNSDVEIVMTSKSYNVSTRELNLTVNCTALGNLTGDYKMSAVLLENNLIYPQNHYSQCGFSGYINDYVHHHNARSMMNGPTGVSLNSGSVWNQNEIISRSLQYVLDQSWVPQNCEIIVFVYKDNPTLALANVSQAIKENVLGPTGISNNNLTADDYSLSQNYPNPFNPVTNIKFSIPQDGKVTFKVYDIFGKEVANYVDGLLQKGTYNVQFDGTNLSSGVYFYVLKTDKFTDKKKMMLVK